MARKPLISAVLLLGLAAAAGCGGGGDDEAGRRPGGTVAPPTAAGTARPEEDGRKPARFTAEIKKLSRSDLPHSWRPGCPVPVSGLRAIDMTHWGMDGRVHEGRLVVNASAAEDLVGVFRTLFERRYPIERMEPVDKYRGSDFDSIEANNTSAFNCRRATGSSSWSQHAYGLAVDLNPCQNPYVTASGRVAHKDCIKFKDRSRTDPGVIHKGDAVVKAFASIGWGWGGSWTGAKDYQHFSSTGR
ncbi:M15 family metallopeptidase [Thermomonospora catenispora]|uniref:M15 family metallopeptidase n=1 Tax=Thermomonospora catenispora TaxID=2493090 RepID=UPI00111DB1A1|nr:M15 family metallopeptidase [Thermomonospora catenispora]TNY37791.1 M15 family peptidase [Thermomonospora catenispora]